VSIEVMKQALEALEKSVSTCFDRYSHEQVMSRPEHFINQTMTALRLAIEQAENDESPLIYVADVTMPDPGYECVVCGRFLPADEHGVIVHDDVPHPDDMTFDEKEKPQ
jgi:hypothetical protein